MRHNWKYTFQLLWKVCFSAATSQNRLRQQWTIVLTTSYVLYFTVSRQRPHILRGCSRHYNHSKRCWSIPWCNTSWYLHINLYWQFITNNKWVYLSSNTSMYQQSYNLFIIPPPLLVAISISQIILLNPLYWDLILLHHWLPLWQSWPLSQLIKFGSILTGRIISS